MRIHAFFFGGGGGGNELLMIIKLDVASSDVWPFKY